MIRPEHFEVLFVRPALELLEQFDPRMNTEAAVTLVMGTAAQETLMGYYGKQLNRGPGLGPFSFEPDTNHSLWRHYLSRPEKRLLKELILSIVPEEAIITAVDAGYEYVYVDPAQLATNYLYSAVMTRLKYWPKSEPMPPASDIVAQGHYWNDHYNVNEKYGTVEEYVANFNKYLSKWKYNAN